MITPEEAPAPLTRAIALLAHELRNQTSTIVTGLGLIAEDDQDASETARDMQPAAGLLLLLVDLIAQTAVTSTRRPATESADLADVGARAARRLRRSGIELEVLHPQDPVVGEIDVANLERCLCAAALAGGRSRGALRIEHDTLTLTADQYAPLLPERVVDAGRLLCAQLAASCGYRLEVEDCVVRLTPEVSAG